MRSAADAAPSFLYLPELARCADEFTLEGGEARYLARVVRARGGERVRASDGDGALATLEVERVRPDVLLRVVERLRVPPPAPTRVLCGAPEGERGDWLVEKLAELGVSELVPLETQRARWPDAQRHERWERLAISALRQSRSPWRLRVAPPAGLEAALAGTGPGARWLADPDGAPGSSQRLLPEEPVTGAIGPSAGFSDDERKLLRSHGFVTVRLAPLRLRTETAAVALAALWAASRGAAAAPAAPAEP
jgi:16S rRNA (uracil1498-N3)-methyltransferase